MKKILFCESPNNSAYYEPILNTLKKYNFKVITFDIEKGNFFTRCIGFIINQLHIKKKLFEDVIYNQKQKHLLYLVKKHKPFLLLSIKSHEIDKNTIKKINDLGIITVNWYPDWLIFWNWIKINAPYYKYFIPLCINLTNKLKRVHPNTYYLPFATKPIKKLTFNHRKYKITFIGQHSPRREYYFKKISDLGLNIWGYSKWNDSSLKNISNPPLPIEKNLEVLKQTKIAVNILTGDNKFQPQGLNNRTLEAMGQGAMLMALKDPIITKYFQDKKDLILFTSPQDLRKKAIYYLNHDKEREKIANSGWDKINKYHTYDIRLKELFKILNLNKNV